jgi:hypothetical protein
MNRDFKKISSFIFLAMAIVLSGEALRSFSDILSIKNDIAEYSEENGRLSAVKEKIDKSLSFAQRNPEIIAKFDIILPDGEGRPNFMSALENIASLNGILIKKINFQKADTQARPAESGGAVNYESQMVDINFNGGYSALKNFLSAMENSLKITDIVRIDFRPIGNVGEGGAARVYDFNVKMKIYWQETGSKKILSSLSDAADLSDFNFTKGKQFTDLIFPPGYGITIDRAGELNNPMPF